MNFQQYLRSPKSITFNIVPFISVFFLLFLFFLFFFVFTVRSGMNINLAKAITSDVVNDNNITIFVTSENVFHYNGKVVTLLEIRDILSGLRDKRQHVLIKSDRRASVGRIVDLWDLGRSLGVEKINIAADQEE